ncbi:diguanylate cyclase [Marinobacterium sp. AK62]|uniref:diguanylate cyclase n=1 Tax=Marinobacterium alkalitolerans TaxID=1542925 RepID=A0ABS3Z8Q4_9GAMM|nr:diguanylate cyclase [Marinobacterium alkalitolerans]MBP0048064.1 diguanylate cyclase [Marinobacterium alkalitolerans]
MTLKYKLIASLLLFLLILGSGIVLIQQAIVIPKVESLETDALKADLERIEDALQGEMTNMEKLAVDWGVWDDVYEYVAQPNPDFIASALGGDALEQLSMDLLLISHHESPALVQTSSRMAALRPVLVEGLLRGDDPRLLAAGGQGILHTDAGIFLVAASKVLPSSGQGISTGTLYFAKRLDHALMQRLNTPNMQSLELAVVEQTPAAPKIELLPGRFSLSQTWLPLLGEPERSLRVELRQGRPFFDSTLTYTYYIMGTIFVLGILGCLTVYLLLQHYLVAPIRKLQRNIERFSALNSLEQIPDDPRTDEIGSLTRSFRKMAARVSQDHAQMLDEREQLKEESLTDPLTGLGNRRFLLQSIEGRKRWMADHHIAVITADLDHFKKVNDQYGHDKGDQVLQEFARLLEECCREDDYLVRSGGEEFIAICQLANAEDVAQVVERIRRKTAESRFADGLIRATCSIGFIVTPASELNQMNNTWERLFKVSDMALYRAKHEGRNRCIGWRYSYLSQISRRPLPVTTAELKLALEEHTLTPVS